jgi:hypothetical protein
MTKLLSCGDLVRIPQDVTLFCNNNYIILDRQRYGIFDKKLSESMAQIIFEGSCWEVNIDDIYEGDI